MADPSRFDLTARKNALWTKTFTFADDTGTPIDLTGYELAMQVRLYQGAAGAALIDLAVVISGQGIRISNAAAGEIEITINKSTLEDLPLDDASRADNDPEVFQYDLKMGPVNRAEVVLYGTFTVVTGVTR